MAKQIPFGIAPILRRPVVERTTGDSRTTLYSKMSKGLFIKPVTLGRNRNGEACQVGWPANEVQAILNARIAGKSDEEVKALVAKLEAARAGVQ